MRKEKEHHHYYNELNVDILQGMLFASENLKDRRRAWKNTMTVPKDGNRSAVILPSEWEYL